jgi:acetolactate synthase-1/2/3 large subunit
MKPVTKWVGSVKTAAGVLPTLTQAVEEATSGVPGPVFVEIPVDLLYPESTVREWFFAASGVRSSRGIRSRAVMLYLRSHLFRQFHGPHIRLPRSRRRAKTTQNPEIAEACDAIAAAEHPVLVAGSQVLAGRSDTKDIAAAVRTIGIPTYLGGSARGLLDTDDPLQFRHKRTAALKEADVVVVAGFPFDFRLNYGRSISSRARVIAANLSASELKKNRKPEMAFQMHPADFLMEVADHLGAGGPGAYDWFGLLREREEDRDAEIREQAAAGGELVNPLDFFVRLESRIDDDSVLVVDGGDFVATASYVLRPRAPLSWLDPGPFGTLGVGGGFALAAGLARPDAQVWLIYGDGSSAYSLAEFDTFARHGVAPIAVVGSDGAWAQIARDQVAILDDDVATQLRRMPYHEVAAGYGGIGILVTDPAEIDAALDEAIAAARAGTPVCINVHIGKSTFREGSLSI